MPLAAKYVLGPVTLAQLETVAKPPLESCGGAIGVMSLDDGIGAWVREVGGACASGAVGSVRGGGALNWGTVLNPGGGVNCVGAVCGARVCGGRFCGDKVCGGEICGGGAGDASVGNPNCIAV